MSQRKVTSNPERADDRNVCNNCGYRHLRTETCRAKGKQCNYCKKWNHFSSVCRAKKASQSVHEVSEGINNLQIQESESAFEHGEDFFVDSVECNDKMDQVFVDMQVGPNSLPIKFKVDTGSQVNILPRQIYAQLHLRHPLEKPTTKLTAYGGETLNTIGCIKLTCCFSGQRQVLNFYVVETFSSPIIGLRSSIDLELIKLVLSCDAPGLSDFPYLTKSAVLAQYAEAFKGIGLFPGECKIHIDPTVNPVVNPPRRIPVALRDKVKQELDRMLQKEIIAPVSSPTQWVNSLVTVENKQSGKLRLCLDPQQLNKAIQRPHYPMRTLEDILPQLSGAKYFSKIDARSGYWAIKLERKSSYLTTFNTPFGRYRFLRLPFGLRCSQDQFQCKVDECFEGLLGVAAIVDDILVYGRTREEHDQRLRKVMERALEKGIRFNEDKLVVGVSEIEYFGNILSDSGMKPSQNKVSAILNMDPPTCRSELETFLGMVTYLSRFCENLAEITSPLRKLLENNVLFSWDKPQDDAFQKVKDLITKAPVLAYYDKERPLTIQCDASKSGLGATLMQDGKPIAYASKSLTQSEMNYAQIEKEMYAIVFACKRFHTYVYGRKTVVETDHLPIVSIQKKPLYLCPSRLTRMLLQLQKYDLDITFKKGVELHIADALSRNMLKDTYPDISEGMDLQVHSVLTNLPVSDRKMQEIKTNIELDPQMKQLKEMIQEGWPVTRSECPSQIIDYWNFRDELTVDSGLILKGNRLVIPLAMRPKMLELLHQGHFGCEKTLNRARDVMFWPKISADISGLVLNCTVCLERRSSNPKEPLKPHDIPDYPWQFVATDLFAWDGQDFLITVDYYSKYFEVQKLPSTRASTIIAKLKSVFARHGSPEVVKSDNAAMFTGEQFSDFARDWNFAHVTISPGNSQSNGLVEKSVGICKRIFSKAKADGKDPYLGLLEYRTTPNKLQLSPSQLLFSRRLRSNLPVIRDQLLPETPNRENVKEKIKTSKENQKKYFNRNAKSLKPLEIGDKTRIQQNDKTWKPAVVTNKQNERSYLVQTPDGTVYRRNRRHLLKTNENTQVSDFGQFALSRPPGETEKEQESLQEPQCTDGGVSDKQQNDSDGPPTKTDSVPYVTRYGRTVRPRIVN
ncbi:MAG: RNase H-like domain-containing protein [Candidatus Thiodiazotropha endolucinida]|nr:DDE-type integrase/transposase/recombinase [Candidatus Thiodiazotropha taylori]MCG8047831.1 DDE-type integrase/transposase/recombinase [Candidatus Thiodiazotropha taylori]MCW4261735.1 RNase H-like domain-containing protein [Candidatus Thiodiazotropha endolucinida]MCW4345575.1 RNase H-like domain-containing protein [Candidatus Thiodiazotropha endolucinida]